ncbi:MAG TPA: sigma-70 family RNA polymerase sigma factor [Pyrinomonadaceae bacterium]|jgi:RNA polymerase sigma factor (sigma-70 family)
MNDAVFTETDYERLRPHLLDALAKLARQGFTVTPWDGIDLIHDFFLEAWNGLHFRFDPSKGTFDAYVYGAFIHFARPRIVKLQRLQSSLVAPEQLDLMHGGQEEEDDERHLPPEKSREVVREAISRLPSREREILSRYLYSKPRAERMLARRFSMSRYALRQTLVEALGRMMVYLDKPWSMPERDWKVALALWRDQRTIDETAAYLGLTTHQVREANSRNIYLLTGALKYYNPPRRGQLRRNTMTPQRNSVSPHELLERALRSPGDEGLLEQVREHADEVLSALEHSEFMGLAEDEIQGIDRLWVAQVYEAMTPARYEENENYEAVSLLLYANQEEEEAIGLAFRETLMADLPAELQDIDRWFQRAPLVDMEERRELIEEVSVQAGMPHSERLIPYGVTPLTVFYGTEAVSSLLSRLVHYEMLHRDVPVLLGMESVEAVGGDSNPLNLELVVDEIERVSEVVSECTARALYGWSVQVARYKPFLFSGFQASPREAGVSLVRTDEVYDNLYQRWAFRQVAHAW